MGSSMRSLAMWCALSAMSCTDDAATLPATDSGAMGLDAAAEIAVDSHVASEAATDTASSIDVADAALPTTFGAVYTTLNAICVDCHKPEEGPEGELDLSNKATAYAQLVGVSAAGPACGGGMRTRVVAGDPSSSLLFQKVSGAPPCGEKMPPGPSPLEAKYLEQIRAWIAAGARDD